MPNKKLLLSLTDIVLDTTVEFLCGIVAHLLLTMVDGCRLTDHGKITSRTDRQGMTYHINTQDVHMLILKTQAVIIVFLFPVFQFDDKIDLLALLDTLNTKKTLNIEEKKEVEDDIIDLSEQNKTEE